MPEENSALVRQFLEELDRRQSPSEELMAQSYVAHIPGFPPFDLTGYQRFVGGLYAAFPDLKHEIDDIIGDRDKVVVRCTVHGTHKGDFAGTAPTGKTVSNTVIAIFRITDGRLAEEWAVSDTSVLMQQIGAQA